MQEALKTREVGQIHKEVLHSVAQPTLNTYKLPKPNTEYAKAGESTMRTSTFDVIWSQLSFTAAKAPTSRWKS